MGFLLRCALRRVSLEQALQHLSWRCGCTVRHVKIDSARAAVDVDSVADRDLAQRILLGQA
jgi:hypothetical protein